MNILKIAAGIVLGLLCWHLFIGYMERWDRIQRQEQAEKQWAEFEDKCQKGDEDKEVCREMEQSHMNWQP